VTYPAQTEINGNVKDYFTVRATVSAAEQKFPIFLIAKGNTTRREHTNIFVIALRMSPLKPNPDG